MTTSTSSRKRRPRGTGPSTHPQTFRFSPGATLVLEQANNKTAWLDNLIQETGARCAAAQDLLRVSGWLDLEVLASSIALAPVASKLGALTRTDDALELARAAKLQEQKALAACMEPTRTALLILARDVARRAV